ncbi:MAG: hemerythrin domain-containing protein [Myxococcota bacterium]
MEPSHVRERVLSDHVALRQLLDVLEGEAKRVRAGERGRAGPLRREAEAFITTLFEHMRWEDRYLAPALQDADAWGEERAAHLAQDHREQRDLLEDAIAKLRDAARPPTLVATNLLDLVSLLRRDMEEEEELLLDERVLRDDVVGIEVETG